MNPERPTLAVYAVPDSSPDGFPHFVHDHNLCLMHKGKIVQYLQLERLTRKKYDNRLSDFIEEIIDDYLPELKKIDFDLVSVDSFVGCDWQSANGRLKFSCVPPADISQISPNGGAKAVWATASTNKTPDAYNVSHELAHVFSAAPFFPIFSENALMVHFDGGASRGNFSAFRFRQNQIELIENHWDLVYAAKWFNANALHFAILNAQPQEHTSVPGKWMGFAAYGRYRPEIAQWLARNDYFKDCWGDKIGAFKEAAHKDWGVLLSNLDAHNPFLQDIAATIQTEFERLVVSKLGALGRQNQCKTLIYTGGCALNIGANSRLIEENIFETVYIPPCCNDAGLSIGGAACLEWQKHGEIATHSPYLNTVGLHSIPEDFPAKLVEKTAHLLAQNAVVGVSNGAGEAGPRALGARSLIARPDIPVLSDKLNRGIKKREWYRPLAPVMLLSEAEKVTGVEIRHELSRFMLLEFEILPNFRAFLAGAVHINGTARIQTIKIRSENPFFFDLLTVLKENYHIVGLINTSFNAAGAPIVHTPSDALAAAKAMKLDALISNYKLFTF